jgi:two-component system, NarL family, nitrate/nitrite response regulator NarL
MQGSPTATVLVVDDDDGLRAMIASLLEQAAYAPVEASSGEAALTTAADSSFDLVLLDVDLPGLSGYEVCRRLREQRGTTMPIMFVSGSRVEALDRVAGLLIGADDYLVKPFAPEELLARVRALLRRAKPASSDYGNGTSLTKRELQVLGLLASGRTQAEIAADLVISPKTVGTHLERVIAKLGVHSRTQAVAFAYRQGLFAGD